MYNLQINDAPRVHCWNGSNSYVEWGSSAVYTCHLRYHYRIRCRTFISFRVRHLTGSEVARTVWDTRQDAKRNRLPFRFSSSLFRAPVCAQNMELVTSSHPPIPNILFLQMSSSDALLSLSLSCPLAAPAMRPDSLLRLWCYINPLLTYLLISFFVFSVRLLTTGSRAFPVATTKIWNSLPEFVVTTTSPNCSDVAWNFCLNSVISVLVILTVAGLERPIYERKLSEWLANWEHCVLQ